MKYIIFAFVALSLASCGTFKRTMHKDDTFIDMSAHSASNEVVTISEKVDTIVTIRADTLSVTVDLDNDSLFIFEDDKQTISITYDRPTNTIRAVAAVKQVNVPVVINKETTAIRNAESDIEVMVEQKTKVVDEKKTSALVPWWLWIAVAALFSLWVWIKFLKPV